MGMLKCICFTARQSLISEQSVKVSMLSGLLLTASCGAQHEKPDAQREPPSKSPGKTRIEESLAKVNAECPKTYPDVVTPLPEPDEAAAMSEDELLAMLKTWNPALRAAVSQELAARDIKIFPVAEKMLASEKWQDREAAARMMARSVRNRVQHWKKLFPEETNWRAGQEKVREKYVDLIPLCLPLLDSDQRSVRAAALGVMGALKPRQKEVSEAILGLFGDDDEYLAQSAMLTLEKHIGIDGVDDATVITAFEEAMKQPLPRGKGHVVRMIRRKNEAFQRKCIPMLLEHLEWIPKRDTMFGAGGQKAAVEILADLGEEKLIPLIPTLMYKEMRGPGLFNVAVAAAGQFGAKSKKLLPFFKDEIAKYKSKLEELKGNGLNRRNRGTFETYKNRLELLREVVANVEE